MAKQVLVRVRRMDKMWATCGIGVRPPEDQIGNPQMKYLCPKLVPGQVIGLPSDHPLLRQKCVEIVRAPERDEFIRPWVFANIEDAALADPSKSGLSADRIRDGLHMMAGAVENRREAFEKRSEGGRSEDFGDDDPALQPLGDENARRSQNRTTADIYDDAEPVSTPSRRRRRAAAS